MNLIHLKAHNTELKDTVLNIDIGGMPKGWKEQFYATLRTHLEAVVFYYCNQSDLKDRVYTQDFWWVTSALEVLRLRFMSLNLYKKTELKFMETYIYKLLECIESIIDEGCISTIVYPRIRNNVLEGYKIYTKQDGVWVGKQYIKMPEITYNIVGGQ